MVTLRNTKEPDSLICQFMTLVDNFIKEKTDFQSLGYYEIPTASEKVIRLSVFIAEKDYDEKDLRWAYELENGRSNKMSNLGQVVELLESNGFKVSRAYEENQRDAGNEASSHEKTTGALWFRVIPNESKTNTQLGS